ncbi:MAG: hypothetical protein MK085_02020 [Phycisphaerales bacterium]|nr:hypothetical protein [Phycisphaerales bacterium]
MPRNATLLLVLCSLIPLTGCGYTLKGRAVSGAYNGVELVPADDPRLRDAGLPGVRVEAIRDPDSLGRSVAGSATSGGNGNIALNIADFGVGWMDEEWDLRVKMSSEEFAQNRVRLPGRNSGLRLLIVIEPGSGRERSSMESEQERRLDDYGISIPDSSIYRR